MPPAPSILPSSPRHPERSEGSRACALLQMPSAPPILPPLIGEPSGRVLTGGVRRRRVRAADRRRLHHPSCLPFEGRWQRRQALTERSRPFGCPPLGRGKPPRRAREGELGRRAKRSWPGPRPGAPFLRAPRPRRAILAYSPNRAEGVPAPNGQGCGLRGRTAHKRERTKVLSLLRITLSPSGRAARVKALSRFAAATHLPLQHEGVRCHPVGARSARPSRPFRSDCREGRCHPVGRDDSARRFFGFRGLGAPSLCNRPVGRTRKREILRSTSFRSE